MSDDEAAVVRAVGTVLLSGLAGLAGAWLVWNLIYAIGASVVSDEVYVRLKGPVTLSGLGAGAIVGLLAVVLRSRQTLATLAAGHVLSVICGFGGGASSWQAGLWGYFGTLSALVIVLVFSKIVAHERSPQS